MNKHYQENKEVHQARKKLYYLAKKESRNKLQYRKKVKEINKQLPFCNREVETTFQVRNNEKVNWTKIKCVILSLRNECEDCCVRNFAKLPRLINWTARSVKTNLHTSQQGQEVEFYGRGKNSLVDLIKKLILLKNTFVFRSYFNLR